MYTGLSSLKSVVLSEQNDQFIGPDPPIVSGPSSLESHELYTEDNFHRKNVYWPLEVVYSHPSIYHTSLDKLDEVQQVSLSTDVREPELIENSSIKGPTYVESTQYSSTSESRDIDNMNKEDESTPTTVQIFPSDESTISIESSANNQRIPTDQTSEVESRPHYRRKIINSAQDSIIFATTEILVWILAMLCI